ncbi:putative DNA replication regulator SLD2 [Apiospora arundinis]|uniref:DNA replication regulator SLD2 n=1 Tax=Apiospora arundinis TaxID=335852 RepID=A0ABR2J6R7_9PEZI
MQEATRKNYEAKAQDLRAQLKLFEGEWAKTNGGKKPDRNAIKQNPDIALKYKKYQQVRDILDGKLPPPKDETKAKKRKSQDDINITPSKQRRSQTTPSISRHKDIFDEVETPSIRRLFSPAAPTSIGPTPHRDGRVLGLFDLLEEKDDNTPSKSRHGDVAPPDPKTQATPSKRKHGDTVPACDGPKASSTPISTSKRAIFMTPLKDRDGNQQEANTPSTVNKLLFSTPSFLRRAPLPAMDENSEYKSPGPIRLPRKPLGRGLSSVVADLRKMEEEKLDEELEALHDMENEGAPAKPTNPTKPKENILVPDSQAGQLLGGFDDEGLYDSDHENQVGKDGQPLPIYKKKGQKRTTRKVNMRPTRSRRPDQPSDSTLRDADDDNRVVPETQLDATKPDSDPLEFGSGSEYDEPDSDKENGERPAKKAKKVTKTKKATEKGAGKDGEKKEGAIKKAARKVNELAHANFKRLKLKNNGAKGGPGFGSRFRRRR